MKKIIIFFVLLSEASYINGALAQGCSDSGFCSMGAFRSDQPYISKSSLRINSIELTQHIGHTKYGDWIHSTFMDVNIGLFRTTHVQLRLPAYTIVRGNMPTTRGWGDVFFSLSQTLFKTNAYQLNATAGAKLYTSRPDKASAAGQPMPLYQQTSYGSNDLNFGFSLLTKRWLVATGYQRALNHVKNDFSLKPWEGDPLYNTVQVYDPSAGLTRGNDVMLRVERNFRLSQYNFYAGLLNLWRITADKTLNENGELQNVDGSKGVAMNFVTGGGYQFSTRMGIRVLASIKLKERKANPDGLSRNFIGQVAYTVRF